MTLAIMALVWIAAVVYVLKGWAGYVLFLTNKIEKLQSQSRRQAAHLRVYEWLIGMDDEEERPRG